MSCKRCLVRRRAIDSPWWMMRCLVCGCVRDRLKWCVCDRERERVCETEMVCVCVRERWCVCVCVCVCKRERDGECVCERETDRVSVCEREHAEAIRLDGQVYAVLSLGERACSVPSWRGEAQLARRAERNCERKGGCVQEASGNGGIYAAIRSYESMFQTRRYMRSTRGILEWDWQVPAVQLCVCPIASGSSLALSHTHHFSLSISHTHTPLISLTHTHSSSVSLCNTHTHTQSIFLSLTHTHTLHFSRSLSLTHTICLSLSISHTHTVSLSLSAGVRSPEPREAAVRGV